MTSAPPIVNWNPTPTPAPRYLAPRARHPRLDSARASSAPQLRPAWLRHIGAHGQRSGVNVRLHGLERGLGRSARRRMIAMVATATPVRHSVAADAATGNIFRHFQMRITTSGTLISNCALAVRREMRQVVLFMPGQSACPAEERPAQPASLPPLFRAVAASRIFRTSNDTADVARAEEPVRELGATTWREGAASQLIRMIVPPRRRAAWGGATSI